METKSHRGSRGFKYSYIHVPPTGRRSVDYILLLHGFPSLAREWYHQIEHFSGLGYGIVAPDLLGYSETSSPLDLAAYTIKGMSQDIVDLLNYEGIELVFAVGHDTGSHLLSRLAIYHPEKVAKIAFLTVGYTGMGHAFDVDFINKMTSDSLGYAAYGYIKYFDSEEAASVLGEHSASFRSLVYAADPKTWERHWGPVGALEEWLKSDSQTEIGPWYSPEDQTIHEKAFAQTRYEPCLNWYRALTHNINLQDEQSISKDSYKISRPVTFIAAGKDPIAIPSVQEQMMHDVVDDMTVKIVDSGHWIHLEQPDAVNNALEHFFEAPATASKRNV